MAYFLFDEIGLITILVGGFLGGFLPLLIMVLRCPEARAFIKAQTSGGVVICTSDDAGTSFEIAKPFGSHGQYISGKNQFGQRKIYVHPKMEASAFTKSFILKGIRRPIFFHGGRTVIVNPNVLKAISVADANKDDLPPEVKAWAEQQKINLNTKKVSELDEDDPEWIQKLKGAGKIIQVTLWAMNPCRLHWYFKEHYDEGQYDVLLEQSRQSGYNEGPAAHRSGGKNKWVLVGLMVFIIMIIIGIAGLALGVKF